MNEKQNKTIIRIARQLQCDEDWQEIHDPVDLPNGWTQIVMGEIKGRIKILNLNELGEVK